MTKPVHTRPGTSRPAVEDHRPRAVVLRLINPVLERFLRSRFHRPFSRDLMLLEITGRKTGRRYLVPVGRHDDGADFIVSVSGNWRYNLTDGDEVAVIVDGRQRSGVMEVVRDVDEVASIFKMLCDRYGRRKASLIGLRVNVPRSPTVEEVRPAVSLRWIAHIRTDE